MSKKHEEDVKEMNIGVNTPEREDEMDEKEFYNEDQAQANDTGDSGDTNNSDPDIAGEDFDDNEDRKAPKGFIAFVKRHWKMLLAVGAVTVVGGVIFVYFMGKTYKIDAKKLTDVIPFQKKETNVIEEKTTEELMELAKMAAGQAEEKTA